MPKLFSTICSINLVLLTVALFLKLSRENPFSYKLCSSIALDPEPFSRNIIFSFISSAMLIF